MTPPYDTDAPGRRVRLTAKGPTLTLAELRELVRLSDAAGVPPTAPVELVGRVTGARRPVRGLQVTRP